MIEVWFVLDGEELLNHTAMYPDLASAYEDTARIHSELMSQSNGFVDIRAVMRTMPLCQGQCGKLLPYPATTYCEGCKAHQAAVEAALEALPESAFGFVHDEDDIHCQCARCRYEVGKSLTRTRTV